MSNIQPPEPVDRAAHQHTDSNIDWAKAQEASRLLLEAVGEDPDRDGLQETWQRRLPAAFETLTTGNRQSEKPELRTFDAESGGLVVKTGIPFYSLCEHHLLPFHGEVHLAYRPNDEVVGLSKLIRYVQWHSRRLTVQEQLTHDIANGLATELDADAVVVECSATHLCEAMRGIETETTTSTRSTVGDLKEGERTRFNDALTRGDR